jgi:hypothetical protein
MPADEIVSKTLGAALLAIIAAAFTFHFVDQVWLTCPHNTTATSRGHLRQSEALDLARRLPSWRTHRTYPINLADPDTWFARDRS